MAPSESKPDQHPPEGACMLPSDGDSCSCDRIAGPENCVPEEFFRQVNVEFLVHELKDPITVIEAGVRMLLDKEAPDAPLTNMQRRTLDRILRNARKSRGMLTELLEVGRAQSACFHCRPFQPYQAVRRILLQAIEATDPVLHDELKTSRDEAAQLNVLASRGIRFDASAAAQALTIEQDDIKFCQIAGNLIKNGLYYRRRHLLLHLAIQHERVSLSVRDDGPGIAPSHQEAVFQRYKQVTPHASLARGGHGLGLAISRILARSLGGDVIVESELGLGALFRFIMPAAFPG